MRQIKVLVVEDSMVFRELLVQGLTKDPAIDVVAVAKDPYEARDAIVKYRPDVMTLDVELPRMNGIEFLKKLLPQYPIPVVVVSSLDDRVFDAMEAGAVEFVSKPAVENRAELEAFIKNELLVKVKVASTVRDKSIHYRRETGPVATPRETTHISNKNDLVIAIGASTGGTEATSAMLRGFGNDLPGIVIVQHMPAGFTKMYADRLNAEVPFEVREAKSGDTLRPGLALLAPGGDRHMELVRQNGQYGVVLKNAPKVNGHCPSVDVLFQSVAKTAGKNAAGIILTGMGGDGAKGLLEMRRQGAHTIGQDEASCVVYGMPKVAYELGAVEFQENLSNIAKRLYTILGRM